MLVGVVLTIVGILFLIWFIGLIVVSLVALHFAGDISTKWYWSSCLLVIVMLLVWPISLPVAGALKRMKEEEEISKNLQ